MIKIIAHWWAWNPTNIEIRAKEQMAVDKAIGCFNSDDSIESAIIKVINSLENNPVLDAWYWSILQLDWRCRMDAGICDSNWKYWAILQIENFRNPISIAKKIFDYGYHSILSWEWAKIFALEEWFKMTSVFTKETVERYLEEIYEVETINYRNLAINKEIYNKKKLSTVWAVWFDDKWTLIAWNSTWWLYYWYPCRVWDTWLFWQWIYASKNVAVACTWEWDIIIKTMLAKLVEDIFMKNNNLQESCDLALMELKNNGWEWWIIAVSKNGETAISHNTTFLAHAIIKI